MRVALAAGDAEQTGEGTERRTGFWSRRVSSDGPVRDAGTDGNLPDAGAKRRVDRTRSPVGVDLDALREERNRAGGQAVPGARIPSTSASPHGVRRLARDRDRFHRFDPEDRHPPRSLVFE